MNKILVKSTAILPIVAGTMLFAQENEFDMNQTLKYDFAYKLLFIAFQNFVFKITLFGSYHIILPEAICLCFNKKTRLIFFSLFFGTIPRSSYRFFFFLRRATKI